MTEASPTSIDTVQELLAVVELEGIEVYELRARGVDRPNREDFEEGFEIKAAVNVTPELIKTRFTMTFGAKVGEYVVDLAVRYRIEREAEDISQTVAIEFAERVGVMAAFPFLREHVYSLAGRLGHPVPVLGLIHQGQFSLTPDEPVPETTI